MLELHGAAGQGNPVAASDYQQSEMMIYKRIQHDCFPEELHHLKEGKPVPNSSCLLTLSPETLRRRLEMGGMTKNVYHGIFLNYTGFTVYDGIYFFHA